MKRKKVDGTMFHRLGTIFVVVISSRQPKKRRAFCNWFCRLVRMPSYRSNSPLTSKIRSIWSLLIGLTVLLLIALVAQTLSSMITLFLCKKNLQGCLEYLKKDPCLKMAVPSFVACLVLLSMFCSCCCQSPKSLSVLLIVNVIGEIAMATYLFRIRGKSSELGAHFRSHLISSMATFCMRPSVPIGFDSSTPIVAKPKQIISCWQVHQSNIPSCNRINNNFLSPIDYINCPALVKVYRTHLASSPYPQAHPVTDKNHSNRTTALLKMGRLLGSCMLDLESQIKHLHVTYKSVTFCTLFISGVLHFVLALVICICDNQRKAAIKRLSVEKKVRSELVKAEIIVNDDAKDYYNGGDTRGTLLCHNRGMGGVGRGKHVMDNSNRHDSFEDLGNMSPSTQLRPEMYLTEHNTCV